MDGLPTKSVDSFIECKYEELEELSRVHIDNFGSVQVCQGISIGNTWNSSLNQIIEEYDSINHPICGPIIKGGPNELANHYGFQLSGRFVTECHYCYTIRRKLVDIFPDQLTPKQVYGIST